MAEREFRLEQRGTQVPVENVQGFKVKIETGFGVHKIWIDTPDGWIEIDLNTQTFSVGEYEG